MMVFLLTFLSKFTAAASGENCEKQYSLWDKHYCQILNNTAKYQRKCVPTKFIPHGASRIKGLILMIHGWTGCADAYDAINSELARDGFIALTPLLPGQGINLGYGCEVPGVCGM